MSMSLTLVQCLTKTSGFGLHYGSSKYSMSKQAKSGYQCKLDMAEKWGGGLIRYPEEELSSPRGLISLMAVVQKRKVRLLLDYWELNRHDAYTAHANVCAEKLRVWQRKGFNVSVLGLLQTYLQIHVYRLLCVF